MNVRSLQTASGWLNALPPRVRGISWMVAGTTCFASMIIFVRLASGAFNAFEIAFWRAFFGLLVMAPFLIRHGPRIVRTTRFGVHVLRNVAQTLSIVSWFYAIGHINLAEGIALQFTVPLFTMALAVVFLKEPFDAPRWVAAMIGFAGVLVILRPGVAQVTIPALVTVFASVLFATSNTFAKALSRTDSSVTVVFYMNLILMPLALCSMLFLPWTWPRPDQWPWLLGVAASGYCAHLCLTQAFRETDANVVMPLDFLKLVWVAILAFLIFGQVPTIWSCVGGLVIFGATYYIVRREAALVRRARTTSAGG